MKCIEKTLTLEFVVLAALSHKKSNFNVLAHLDTKVVIASIKEWDNSRLGEWEPIKNRVTKLYLSDKIEIVQWFQMLTEKMYIYFIRHHFAIEIILILFNKQIIRKHFRTASLSFFNLFFQVIAICNLFNN